MTLPKQIQQLAVIASGFCAFAASADYLGTLKLPRSDLETPNGAYSFSSALPGNMSPTRLVGENGHRLTLGYKYSRFFSVESEIVDFGSPGSLFATPAHLASSFRSTGLGVDTIATLPIWRFSFYGRLGAYRGEGRNAFSFTPVSLLGDTGGRTRLRYGLGMRYDFTKAFGIRAEMERYSPLGGTAGETESDLFSLGVSWRF